MSINSKRVYIFFLFKANLFVALLTKKAFWTMGTYIYIYKYIFFLFTVSGFKQVSSLFTGNKG